MLSYHLCCIYNVRCVNAFLHSIFIRVMRTMELLLEAQITVMVFFYQIIGVTGEKAKFFHNKSFGRRHNFIKI